MLKAFGISPGQRLKSILKTVFMLILFGVAINGIFEFIKLIPTFSLGQPEKIDIQALLINLGPLILFSFLFYRHLKKIERRKNEETQSTSTALPRRGIVLALSTPKGTTPQDIINQIDETTSADALFDIWSIGQLFKGLYYHRESLRSVFLITTDSSKPFQSCIEHFLNKFAAHVPQGKVTAAYNVPENPNVPEVQKVHLVKSFLSSVYAPENLSWLKLKRSDIIVDISGGTKPLTIGMIFGALDSDIDIQYVEQKSFELIYLPITPASIVDKLDKFFQEMDL